jgi:hypothetical protein
VLKSRNANQARNRREIGGTSLGVRVESAGGVRGDGECPPLKDVAATSGVRSDDVWTGLVYVEDLYCVFTPEPILLWCKSESEWGQQSVTPEVVFVHE